MKTHDIEIAVYGGAFNPPHIGHVNAIEQARCRSNEVLVVPSFAHPFGKIMAPFEMRCDWLKRVIDSLAPESAPVSISNIEQTIYDRCPGPVYSWCLLRAVAEHTGIPSKSIALIVGQDNMEHFHRFRFADRIYRDFNVLVVKENVRVHSTHIRNAISQGKHVDPEWLAPGMTLEDLTCFKPSTYSGLSHAI